MTEKQVTIWDLLNDLNSEKNGLFYENEENQKTYNPYIFNLMLSYHPDAILLVNELNQRPFISKRFHHDFLFHRLPKRKRFAKLAKESFTEKEELLAKILNITEIKAREIADFYDENDVAEMREMLNTGGMEKKTKGRKKK